MQYEIRVTFRRELEDDAEAIGVKAPTPAQLAKQLAVELQHAYSHAEGHLAGRFEVTAVKVGNVLTTWTPGNG